jgi:carboxyl-terminal processing protease
MEQKNNKFLLPIAFAVMLAVGLVIGNAISPKMNMIVGNGEASGNRYQKVQEIITKLDQKYVDDVNGEQLFEDMIGDMLHKLDPHSNYIPAKELKAMNESIQGKFGGIGVRFLVIKDTICLTFIIKGSPSEAVGILPGDKIVQIEKENVAGKKITTDKIMSLLKGEEGTKVNVKILRGKKILPKTITRGSIPIESVSCATMLNKHIGYIKIDQFSVTTADEFHFWSENLKSKGMTKLVLDLRNNGGGVLGSASQIVDDMLPGGLPIVKTEGKHSSMKVYKSTAGGNLEKMEIAVLINENSASASEIVAGALQDNDRAVVIGRRSFGKGLVQEDIPLHDGSNLRLTIARYYTPTGRCIQKPYTDNIEDYYDDHNQRMSNGELYAIDSTVFVDSLKFKTPKGKTVYGGGGIMPDYFIPLDTVGLNWYYTNLRYSVAFQAFAFDYVQDKRTKWKSPKDFNASFQITDAFLETFIKFAAEHFDVPINRTEFNEAKKHISLTLKGEIARQIWVEQGYFIVVQKTDKEVLKAIELLK